MKLTNDDIARLHREFRDVLREDAYDDDVLRMLVRAQELRDARARSLEDRFAALYRDARNEIERRIMRNQCVGCGADHGADHRTSCLYVAGGPYSPDAAGVATAVPRTAPVGLAAMLMNSEPDPDPEPELTPAERTWRAHKGFTR